MRNIEKIQREKRSCIVQREKSHWIKWKEEFWKDGDNLKREMRNVEKIQRER